MTTETVTVPKAEYERVKEMAKIDVKLVEKLKRSFEDIKQGRISEVKPKKIK